MSDETFTQIIFPPKDKPVTSKISTYDNVNINRLSSVVQGRSSPPCPKENDNKYFPRQIYCSQAGGMVLLLDCVRCKHPTETLETILTIGMGC
jgi:hypothetical protein